MIRGFTIVELLVVLTIIALLVGLALPAVNSAREASRLNACQATQMRLALAMSRIDSFDGVLPGWRNRFMLNPGLTHTYPTSPPTTVNFLHASWAVMLLPQLGHIDIYERMKAKEYWAPPIGSSYQGRLLPAFVCPSGLSTSTSQAYEYSSVTYGVNVANNDSTDGALIDRVWSTRDQSLDTIRSGDGLSSTFLIADAYYGPNAWPGGWGPAWHVNLFDHRFPTNKYADARGLMLGLRSSVMTPVFNNPTGAANNGAPVLALPRSAHPSGVVLAFCDGSTRFVRDTIERHVWAHICTSRSLFNGTNYRSAIAPGVNSDPANAWLMAGRTVADEPYRLRPDDY
jgi:prepilin-type N-terminal cleavage/methylation domain-containing protein